MYFLVVKRNLLRCLTKASDFYAYTIKKQAFKKRTQTIMMAHVSNPSTEKTQAERERENPRPVSNTSERAEGVAQYRASGPTLGASWGQGCLTRGIQPLLPLYPPKLKWESAWHHPSKLTPGIAKADSESGWDVSSTSRAPMTNAQ
jgi:hypothetical protein